MKHLVKHSVAEHRIVDKIYIIRGEKVMLDKDLSQLYGVTTGNLNKAVIPMLNEFARPEFIHIGIGYINFSCKLK